LLLTNFEVKNYSKCTRAEETTLPLITAAARDGHA